MAVVPILTYHSIDESGSPVAVSRDQFLGQMSFLAGRGFSVIPLSTLCRQWSTGGELPARPVVLTFDDGYRNTLVDGVPVLTRFGFTATIFVVSAYVGAMNDWPTQPSWVPRLPLLEWDELRELSRQGFEIGSHTETHARLRGLPADRQDREIVGSRQTLEDRLGTAVNSLAYPYGEWDDCSRRLASARYEIACGTRLRSGKPSDDLLDLPRIDAFYLRPPGVFKLQAAGHPPGILLSGPPAPGAMGGSTRRPQTVMGGLGIRIPAAAQSLSFLQERPVGRGTQSLSFLPLWFPRQSVFLAAGGAVSGDHLCRRRAGRGANLDERANVEREIYSAP